MYVQRVQTSIFRALSVTGCGDIEGSWLNLLYSRIRSFTKYYLGRQGRSQKETTTEAKDPKGVARAPYKIF